MEIKEHRAQIGCDVPSEQGKATPLLAGRGGSGGRRRHGADNDRTRGERATRLRCHDVNLFPCLQGGPFARRLAIDEVVSGRGEFEGRRSRGGFHDERGAGFSVLRFSVMSISFVMCTEYLF